MDRFKMSFNNSGYMPVNYSHYSNLAYNINAAPKPTPAPLNASMIDRVHKAKPGCSACGKKVA
jgi:hypothetical protein